MIPACIKEERNLAPTPVPLGWGAALQMTLKTFPYLISIIVPNVGTAL